MRTLRQALAYGWSVAVAALPAEGKATFERWLDSSDPDVRWLLRENLRKQRLKQMDSDWVERSLAQLGRGGSSRPRA